MDKKKQAKFKILLLEERERLMNIAKSSKLNDIHVSSDDLADEADLASVGKSQDVIFNLRERDSKRISEIDDALEKIEDGEYGTCEDCGTEIPVKRLEIFPTAKFCVKHQEESERRSKNFVA